MSQSRSSSLSLTTLIEQRLSSGNLELPVFDDIALRVHREVRENKLDAHQMCAILEEDPVLVSEMLRMANSSYYAGLVSVATVQEAAVRLGLKQMAALVMSVSHKRLYSKSSGHFQVRLTQLWLHSSAASIGARWLAHNAGYREFAEDAFVAGLLHDVGKLSLLGIIEDIVLTDRFVVTDQQVCLTLQQLFCVHGAWLAEKWNLPESFRDVIAYQDQECHDESNVVLCIVRLIDKACQLEGISDMPTDATISLQSMPEARALGLSEIDLAELRLVLEDCRESKRAA